MVLMPKYIANYGGKSFEVTVSRPPNARWFTGRIEAWFITGITKKEVVKNMMMQLN